VELWGANLSRARLTGANLRGADLIHANLSSAVLSWANLSSAVLIKAILIEAKLYGATLVETDLTDADLTGCHVYGISAWNLDLERTKQQNLVITAGGPTVTVDNIEVAQFIYLLLGNEKIRDDVVDVRRFAEQLRLGAPTRSRLSLCRPADGGAGGQDRQARRSEVHGVSFPPGLLAIADEVIE